MRAKIISDPEYAYLTWFNDFLTVKRFAEYFQLEIQHAKKLIQTGRELNTLGTLHAE
jgi:hypothetical protein